ncbi:MAG: GTPase ObgE [Bacilli bacterium]|jgi:GTP-binding protein
MFIDEVVIKVKAGRGGNGIVAFRREKYVPFGGPSGGDGGNGGSIIFIGDEGLTTLLDFRYQKKITSENGQNGMSKNKFGKNGENTYIRVPIGSVIYDYEKKIIIGDITKDKQELLVASGGKGGKGNARFATSRVTAPEICEKGEPGEEKTIKIELKLLADVGLVGLPNAGKSTLISALSKAKVKIADYPFTTLVPNLGVVQVPDGRSFVMADLPGLIEGASSGLGLGYRFLKHIERTRVIIHLIDISQVDEHNLLTNYSVINKELEKFNPKLLERPMLVVLNKIDIISNRDIIEKMKEVIDRPIIEISAYTRENLDKLLYKVADLLETSSITTFEDKTITEFVEYKYEKEEEKFVIKKDSDGVYNVEGAVVKKIFERTDFSNETNAKIFARKLRTMGVDAELRKLGVKNGDVVRIFGYEFEFIE